MGSPDFVFFKKLDVFHLLTVDSRHRRNPADVAPQAQGESQP